MAGRYGSSIPFIGHLYSARDGRFYDSCLIDGSTICDISFRDNNIGVDVDIIGRISNNIENTLVTHVVTAVYFETDKYSSSTKNVNIQGNVMWIKSKDRREVENLQIDITDHRNCNINKLQLLQINVFKNLLISDLNRYSLRNDSLLPLLTKLRPFLSELNNFNAFICNEIKFCIEANDIYKTNEILDKAKKIDEETVTKIKRYAQQINDKNWYQTLMTILDVLEHFDNEVDLLQKEYNLVKNNCLEKARFVQNLEQDGIIYFGSEKSLNEELNNPFNRAIEYYIIAFCNQFMIDDPVKNKTTFEKFADLLKSVKNSSNSTKFLAVDIDLITEKLPLSLRTTTIFLFKSGKVVSENLLASSENKNEKSYVKCCDKNFEEGKPQKRCLLKIPCPQSLNGFCSSEVKEWSCSECDSQVEYGFDDNFYCSCGKSKMSKFSFKCNDFRHGSNYEEGGMQILSRLLIVLTPMNEISILLLGPSGVGKSTWINGIANYLTYNSLENAASGKVLSPIAIKFTWVNDDFKDVEIKYGKDDNEDARIGTSGTQNCRTYYVYKDNTIINFIDTPGLSDPRGIEQDQQNVKKILDYVRHTDYLHGICILLKPNEYRLGVLFRYCIKEILTHLHKSASNNIVFCFTHSRTTLYRGGETISLLIKILQESNITLPLDFKDRFYFLDNESYRFLCTLNKTNVKTNEMEKVDFARSWRKSVEETERLINFVHALTPHRVKDTMSINDARTIILSLTKPVADLAKNIDVNISVIKDRQRIINSIVRDEEELMKNLYVPHIQLTPKKLGYPRTVCVNSSCTETRKLKGSNISETVFVTHCHSHCYLKNVIPETYPNTELKNCAAMKGTMNCKKCQCSWEKHIHYLYEQIQTEQMIKDATTEREIKSKKSLREKKEVQVKSLQGRINYLQREKRKLMKISAKFGIFLKLNAITPYNDSMKDYLAYLIGLESSKVDKTEVDRDVIRKLQETLSEYEKEVKALEKATSSKVMNYEEYTPENIKKLQKELYSLPICGKQLENIMNIASMAQENALLANSQNMKMSRGYTVSLPNLEQLHINHSPRIRGRGRGRNRSRSRSRAKRIENSSGFQGTMVNQPFSAL